MSNYQLFQNDLPLQSLKSFKGDITIDTETLGLNIKRDRLCLIQLRNESNKKVYLIKFDKDISPANSKNIKSLLEDKSLTKIFHYARFDMAVLKENLNINVKNVFCTKIASKLTRTYSSKHGLKDLVKEILNIELDKTEQTSDWSQKKLTKQQIQYAMNDVIYLSDLKKNLETKLLEAKRLKTFKSIMNFLETRVELDLMGWENTDIFAHK
jgi:ribonuclease D